MLSYTALLAAAFGLGVGLGYRISSSSSEEHHNAKSEDQTAENSQQQQKTPTQHLCECGFDLTPCAPLQISRHLQSALHRNNMHRTRGAPLLLTAKINEYRHAISTHVNPNDVVLEVGCAEGLTTQRLAQRAKIAIGIDLYERLITKARLRIGKPPENAQDDDYDDSSIPQEKQVVNAPAGRGWSNLHFYTADAMDKKAVLTAVNRALGVDEAQYEEAKRQERAKVDAMIEAELKMAAAASAANKGSGTSKNVTPIIADISSAEDLSRKQRRLLRRAAIGKQDCKETDGENIDAASGTVVPAILRSTGRLHTGKVNKIWLDVSGSRETRTVVQLVEVLDAMFRPELIVVKSDKLKNMARRMHLPSSNIPGITHEPIKTPYVIN